MMAAPRSGLFLLRRVATDTQHFRHFRTAPEPSLRHGCGMGQGKTLRRGWPLETARPRSGRHYVATPRNMQTQDVGYETTGSRCQRQMYYPGM